MIRITKVQLDRERNLRFGFRGFIELENKFGCGIQGIMERVQKDMRMSDIAEVFCAGLKHEDRDLTTDRVIDLIDAHLDVGEAVNLVLDAFSASFGDLNEEEKNPPAANLSP